MKTKPHLKQSIAGFTLIELLVVITIVAILAAIAVPGWLQFLTRQRLNAAQDKALTVLRDAQADAKREKRPWEVCFYNDPTQSAVLWSTHPIPSVVANSTANPAATSNCQQDGGFESLIGSDSKTIKLIDTTNPASLPKAGMYYYVQFDFNGNVPPPQATGTSPLGQITFVSQIASSDKRCVYISTLLGSIITNKDKDCGN